MDTRAFPTNLEETHGPLRNGTRYRVPRDEEPFHFRDLYGETFIVTARNDPAAAMDAFKAGVPIDASKACYSAHRRSPIKAQVVTAATERIELKAARVNKPKVGLIDLDDFKAFRNRNRNCTEVLEVDLRESDKALKIYSYRATEEGIVYTIHWSCPPNTFDFYLSTRKLLTPTEVVDIVRPLVEKYAIYKSLFNQ